MKLDAENLHTTARVLRNDYANLMTFYDAKCRNMNILELRFIIDFLKSQPDEQLADFLLSTNCVNQLFSSARNEILRAGIHTGIPSSPSTDLPEIYWPSMAKYLPFWYLEIPSDYLDSAELDIPSLISSSLLDSIFPNREKILRLLLKQIPLASLKSLAPTIDALGDFKEINQSFWGAIDDRLSLDCSSLQSRILQIYARGQERFKSADFGAIMSYALVDVEIPSATKLLLLKMWLRKASYKTVISVLAGLNCTLDGVSQREWIQFIKSDSVFFLPLAEKMAILKAVGVNYDAILLYEKADLFAERCPSLIFLEMPTEWRFKYYRKWSMLPADSFNRSSRLVITVGNYLPMAFKYLAEFVNQSIVSDRFLINSLTEDGIRICRPRLWTKITVINTLFHLNIYSLILRGKPFFYLCKSYVDAVKDNDMAQIYKEDYLTFVNLLSQTAGTFTLSNNAQPKNFDEFVLAISAIQDRPNTLSLSLKIWDLDLLFSWPELYSLISQ